MRERRILSLLAAAIVLSGCGVSKYAANQTYPTPKTAGEPRDGELREVFIPSSEPGLESRHAYVYLPAGYASGTERYPVFYLLHGARGNETVWIDKGRLLHNIDSLSRAGSMVPSIVVLPNANQYNDIADYGHSRLKGALESFYEVDGTVEAHFVGDVVGAVDSLFRTIPEKDSRAIAGMSIGAMQSMYISAGSPEVFGYVGMFSPMVHSFLKAGPDNKFYRDLQKKQKVQFEDAPKLYILMIGKTDFFYPSIKSYDKELTRRGLKHEFHVAEGGHEWYNWEEFCNIFMQRMFK